MQVKNIFLPTDKPLTLQACAPMIATLPLEVSIDVFFLYFFQFFRNFRWYTYNPRLACVIICYLALFDLLSRNLLILPVISQVRGKIGDFIMGTFSVFQGMNLTEIIVFCH